MLNSSHKEEKFREEKRKRMLDEQIEVCEVWGALWDCEKSAGLGAKFLWKISKSHSSSRDYGQGQGNWRIRACNA